MGSFPLFEHLSYARQDQPFSQLQGAHLLETTIHVNGARAVSFRGQALPYWPHLVLAMLPDNLPITQMGGKRLRQAIYLALALAVYKYGEGDGICNTSQNLSGIFKTIQR